MSAVALKRVASSGSDELLEARQHRGIVDELGRAVDDPGELGRRLQAVLRRRLVGGATEVLHLLGVRVRAEPLGDVVDVEAGVPDVQRAHPGERPHRLPVGGGRGHHDRAPLLGAEALLSAGDGEAGDEPLDVPLERSREGLVEVVDAEHQATVGRREGAEVGQVGVAAQLHLEPGARRGGEVGGHDRRRTAVERERRRDHPAVADRDELGHPASRPGAATSSSPVPGPVRPPRPPATRAARRRGRRDRRRPARRRSHGGAPAVVAAAAVAVVVIGGPLIS